MQRRRVEAWEELSRTAARVRAGATLPLETPTRDTGRLVRRGLLALAAGALAVAGALLLLRTPTHAIADSGADSTLFSLTNQDRGSNGVGSLNFNGTLGNIGESAGYDCGVHVNGRALDMIQRNYFSHVIQGCGQYVFSMMSAFGVHYQSAGENIGWVANAGGGGSAASYINGQFMNSPDHRSNILNGNYTDMGAGSALSPPGVTWTGSGAEQNVWMFAEEFAQLGAAPPPPPPPPVRTSGGTQGTSSRGGGSGSGRNSPAPPAPEVPAASATPAPTPTPTPSPTPTPIPAALLPENVPAPPAYAYPGLLPTSVESVLEAFLIA